MPEIGDTVKIVGDTGFKGRIGKYLGPYEDEGGPLTNAFGVDFGEDIHWFYEYELEVISNYKESSASKIEQECDNIKRVLLEKNSKYGDSALNPVRVFSKSDALEQIKVRLDDKLSRINNNVEDDEDVTLDLLGYLILYRIAKRNK